MAAPKMPMKGMPKDMAKKMKKHPGFKNAQAAIAKRQGISMDRAGAILAAGARKASPAAKKANPRLKKVTAAKKKSSARKK